MIVKHPDLDAALNIDLRGAFGRLPADTCELLLDFLARGRSQKRAKGKVVGYTTRNPDRRKLVIHVLQRAAETLDKAKIVAWRGAGDTVHRCDVALRCGACGRHHDGAPVAKSAPFGLYQQAGNFRWRAWIRVQTAPESWAAYCADPPWSDGRDAVLEHLVERFGLVTHPKHRPVESTWPLEEAG